MRYPSHHPTCVCETHNWKEKYPRNESTFAIQKNVIECGGIASARQLPSVDEIKEGSEK